MLTKNRKPAGKTKTKQNNNKKLGSRQRNNTRKRHRGGKTANKKPSNNKPNSFWNYALESFAKTDDVGKDIQKLYSKVISEIEKVSTSEKNEDIYSYLQNILNLIGRLYEALKNDDRYTFNYNIVFQEYMNKLYTKLSLNLINNKRIPDAQLYAYAISIIEQMRAMQYTFEDIYDSIIPKYMSASNNRLVSPKRSEYFVKAFHLEVSKDKLRKSNEQIKKYQKIQHAFSKHDQKSYDRLLKKQRKLVSKIAKLEATSGIEASKFYNNF